MYDDTPSLWVKLQLRLQKRNITTNVFHSSKQQLYELNLQLITPEKLSKYKKQQINPTVMSYYNIIVIFLDQTLHLLDGGELEVSIFSLATFPSFPPLCPISMFLLVSKLVFPYSINISWCLADHIFSSLTIYSSKLFISLMPYV